MESAYPRHMNHLAALSVSAYGEHDLVDKILDDVFLSQMLFDGLGIDCVTWSKRRAPFSDFESGSGIRGDVDILLVPRQCFGRAIAFEVKRVKVSPGSLARDQVYKLEEIAKGVLQTEKLVQLGFSRVYLLVFVVVDARAVQSLGSPWLSGVTRTMQEDINRAMQIDTMPANAGLIQLELVQVVDKDICDAGAAGTIVRKESVLRAQPLTHDLRSRPPTR